MSEEKETTKLVDHLFRNEFGKAVSHLTKKFGITYLEDAEDAVQEALVRAMQTWPFRHTPDNPSGWIIKVAKNRLIDQIRRQQRVFYTTQLPENTREEAYTEDLFSDDVIKMMFATCNPGLSEEHQLILVLKLLGGLSIREIAKALLKSDQTIAKSYTRAKKAFKKQNIKLDLPPPNELPRRLDTILKTIYLIFNEGYKSTEGPNLIQKDLCDEAMRLNHILLGKCETNNDCSRSLMALMHFQISRLDARTDENHEIILLEKQDRNKWNKDHIMMGNRYLNSIKHKKVNEYFLQAAICGIHCNTPSYESTNWKAILMLYDSLYALKPNPMVLLNRTVPLSKVKGPKEALKQLNALDHQTLPNTYLFPAIKAQLYLETSQKNQAKAEFQKAFDLTTNEAERNFISKKLLEL